MIKDNYLLHYGVKGMKWGVRRYQDYDGSRLSNGVKINPGRSMPMSRMHSEPAPKSSTSKRHQSLKNIVRGYGTGHYLRNKLNKNLPKNDTEAAERGWRKLSDKDSSMHQFHREDGVKNSKWISPNGHREVVFTGKGENQHITTDPRDQGTYNFFDPKKHPIGHATLDVLPYMLWGNSADDSTTLYSRTSEAIKNFRDKTMDALDDVSLADGEEYAKKMLG